MFAEFCTHIENLKLVAVAEQQLVVVDIVELLVAVVSEFVARFGETFVVGVVEEEERKRMELLLVVLEKWAL